MRSQLARRVDRPCSADPQQLTSLAEVLGRIPDPRRVRGRRYRLNSLLALCLVAVLGGATPLAAIARFAADTHPGLREQLELASSTPNASTLGRLLARLNGDALDDAEGAWLARYAAAPVDEGGDTLAGLAVDGQPVRGSRTDGAAVHLLAAALHSCQTGSPSARSPQRATRYRPRPRCWTKSTCTVSSSPPMRYTPSAPTPNTSSPPAATTSWWSRATRRSRASSGDTCPGARSRCKPAPPGPGTAAARSAA